MTFIESLAQSLTGTPPEKSAVIMSDSLQHHVLGPPDSSVHGILQKKNNGVYLLKIILTKFLTLSLQDKQLTVFVVIYKT